MKDWLGKPLIIVKCPGDFRHCIGNLPAPDLKTVLLVDASGQSDIEEIVGRLRSQGWRYVIVVAADPSVKEATAVLRGNPGNDYWDKTYDEKDIRKRIDQCVGEITTELPPMTRKSE
jgi:hypothetical protein